MAPQLSGGRWAAPTKAGRGENVRVERKVSRDHESCVAPWRSAARKGTRDEATAPAPIVPDSRTQAEAQAYDQALDAGLEDFQAGRLVEAVEHFKRCAQLWPEHSTPPYNLACCYSVANQLDTATQYLWAAVERGAVMSELHDDPDLLPITTSKNFANTLRMWEGRLQSRAKARRREKPARLWRETPANSRPSSASASSTSRDRIAFNQPRAHQASRSRSHDRSSSRSRSRSRSRERPQSAPAPQQLSPTLQQSSQSRRSRASSRGGSARAAGCRTSRRSSAPTLRPVSARPSSATPAVLGDHSKGAVVNVLPDYLSKGYSTAGFGGPGRVCIEVGNHWEPVPDIHARLASQCGAVGAKLFPTTVEEWSERLDLLTDQGALRMSSDQKAHKATDHGLQVLRDALAARRKMYGTTIRDLKAVFDSIDKDGSGALDHDEFATAMHRLGLGLADEQVEEIIKRLDQDGDGEINYNEFAAELAARPLPDSAVQGGDATQLQQRGGPPLPAEMLAKYQYAEDTAILNTKSWTVVVRDASGASLSEYISHIEFRLPEDSGFDETVVLCYEEPFEISRVGHSRLKVLITIHLWSGGGYCFEHELNFDPGQRTDGGGHTRGGKIRRVHFQPVEAPQLQAEAQAAKEHDAAFWWAELEAEREKLANHPRFPSSSMGAADISQDDNDGMASHYGGAWTDGMKQANAAIRDRTNQLRSEHAQALSELKALQKRVGLRLTEEETQQRALAREQRKAEAAKLREQIQRQEKKREAGEAQRAQAAERTRAVSDALSILRRTKHSDALGRRSKELMRQQQRFTHSSTSQSLQGAVGDASLNDPNSPAYQAVARDLEMRTAAVTGTQTTDAHSRGSTSTSGNGGTLASLRAAGAISPQRMAAEVEARLIVQDATTVALHDHGTAMAMAQAEADEQLEIEASEAPGWSEWKGLKSGGVEIALASETLSEMRTSDIANKDSVKPDVSAEDASAGGVEELDHTLSRIVAEIEALEQIATTEDVDDEATT